jgi:chemotaxis protein MotB
MNKQAEMDAMKDHGEATLASDTDSETVDNVLNKNN